EKALHEAKLRTSWLAPDAAYEEAARSFLDAVMDDDGFAAEAAGFAARIGPAGAINGLAQVVLKLTVPGVPDLYQGTEFWDQSLVDPDNRRPVDFAARMTALEAAEAPAALAQTWRDGRVKQAAIARVLTLRRQAPELFARGDYTPIAAAGPCAKRVIAFARRDGDAALLVVVARLPFGLAVDSRLHVAPATWAGTTLPLPAWLNTRTLRDVIDEAGHRAARALPVGAMLAGLPVAVLT
ncbi:MAG: malto-oligosyltrehalose synthase, partial [Acetobacteraceae bacterium]